MSEAVRKPVLVLGASGFIGSRVVGALSSHPVYRPVAVSRRGSANGPVQALNATDAAAVRDAVRQASSVVNCIAGADRTMVQATEALCAAAPERVVHLSSMAVYGAASGVVREDHAAVAPVSGYGQAKIDCEAVVQRYVAGGGEAIILRPTCVFGPGSTQWTTRIARLLQARRLGDLGKAGDGCCNLAYIDDLIASVVASLGAPDASGRTYNVSSSAELTWNAFLKQFAQALGATPVRRIPGWSMKLETKLLAAPRRIGSKFVRHAATEALTPSLSALFTQEVTIDFTAMQRQLGVEPTSMERMIVEAVRWLEGRRPVQGNTNRRLASA
jgi:2-alkyl-3-oxoalkanoate reductase